MTDTREAGRTVLRSMMGEGFLTGMEGVIASGGPFSEVAGLALDFAFGAVWARPGLDLRSRSLVTIGILIGQGKIAELTNHLRAGFNNGLTPKELEEALIQAIPYAGFPAFAEAQKAAVAVLREAGAQTAATPQERGLLPQSNGGAF
ncbi:4-carboxymuconolactone decarboxylase (plasmid) [Azospirillum sp. B510]|uniref:carboxymuconolactone decarboxylase family protein n=1 Tax=Azospirillum sp. (strain B510) TaxID=137722 RepID=UPI0001C4CB8C|nr:carboxymuconolactone decarboxylase family protein [Azospirillum sp. B510]BAI74829.1 4-carboxymuconolactone decarboxylase [Azospirillum sp. B510]